ncbi:XRE family transcriptional regulator [Paraburkholderia bannensis]|nr:helix-turn-helix transcriptional regulator [Paraburkholderia bannensis]RQM47091.1 XRE family transcriptional regulator [Paraburkholderia bannensis]
MTDDIIDAQKAARHLVSANLKSLRKKVGLSQEGFADLAGLHRTYVGNVERETANITLDVLVLIASKLGVEPEDLLNKSPEVVPDLKKGRPAKVAGVSDSPKARQKAK